ncbi:MAG TPA: aldo/keto reductase, partial [Acidimicrobiales bacterium]|nr:aldo/keto reductase [Acidimicrobiales bacterium]
AVADELGVPSSQVALAWTMARRPSLHPIVGARRLDQLTDNMAAADLELPEAAVGRLDAISAFERGFPMDMIESTRAFVYGPVLERMDTR